MLGQVGLHITNGAIQIGFGFYMMGYYIRQFEITNKNLYELVMNILACFTLQNIWSKFVDILYTVILNYVVGMPLSLSGIMWLAASIGFIAFLGVFSDKVFYTKLKNAMARNNALSAILALPAKVTQTILQLCTRNNLLAPVIAAVYFLAPTDDVTLYFKLALGWFTTINFVACTLQLSNNHLLPNLPVRTMKIGALLYIVWLSSCWFTASCITWPQMLWYVSPLSLGVLHHLVLPNANNRISFNNKMLSTYRYFTRFSWDNFRGFPEGAFPGGTPFLVPFLFYLQPFPLGYTTVFFVILVLSICIFRISMPDE